MRRANSAQGERTDASKEASDSSPDQDQKLLGIYSKFQVMESELDRLVEGATTEPEEQFVLLHDEWSQALSRAAKLRARTVEGWRAKAAMLLAALRVIPGNGDKVSALGELLATSLLRDLSASVIAKRRAVATYREEGSAGRIIPLASRPRNHTSTQNQTSCARLMEVFGPDQE